VLTWHAGEQTTILYRLQVRSRYLEVRSCSPGTSRLAKLSRQYRVRASNKRRAQAKCSVQQLDSTSRPFRCVLVYSC
jgi:hypothetical protein